MNRPGRRTPTGAYLHISRGPRWTRIWVDRMPMLQASTEVQAATALRLLEVAAQYVASHIKRGEVSFGGGVFTWDVTVPAGDADTALAALLALETGDPAPAEALADRLAGQ